MPGSNRLKNQHILWRTAFGPMAENIAKLDHYSQKELWDLLISASSAEPRKLIVTKNLSGNMKMEGNDEAALKNILNDKEKRRELRQRSRQDLKTLNLLWMDEMVNSASQLREKMSLFWHGHFACRIVNGYFQQELLHTIRTNALGDFRQLLKAVSKSPAMLQFLNNQQNRKSHPNENFAREVMELFTMGRANYSENDIKEAARAFTGWGFNMEGEFVFRKAVHDAGSKTFLGHTGNFTGDDILEILLQQQQTANHITQKIYRYIVNEEADAQKIQYLAERFYKNNYDIRSLLTDIVMSDWFYSAKNIGNRIKSPVELLVGIRRMLPLQLDNDSVLLLFQKILGQELFFPPNVAGWPGARSWIDSSTLMVRLQVPQVFAAKESISVNAKIDDDVSMGQEVEEQLRIRKNRIYAEKGAAAEIDWSLVMKHFDDTPREQLLQNISAVLLQTQNRIPLSVLHKYINAESREQFIKTAVIHLMSTPEYQLC